MVEVLLPGGGSILDDGSPRLWPSASRREPVPPEPVDLAEFLREEHHRYYGRPWILGRYYVDELIRRGVEPGDRVLDFGCGAGRVGGLLTAYLDADGYCGIDAHLRALTAFARYECVFHGVEAKRPRLMFSDSFDVAAFGEQFDVVLDFYATQHLVRPAEAFERIAQVCKPGARLFMPYAPNGGVEALMSLGFELAEVFEVTYPLLIGSGKQSTDTWRLFRRV